MGTRRGGVDLWRRDSRDSLNGDLVAFHPRHDIVEQFQQNYGGTTWHLLTWGNPAVQLIEHGHGKVNLDYYPVVIERLPTIHGATATPEQLLNDVFRRHLNDFLDHSAADVVPYDTAAGQRWMSDHPLGAVMTWSMPNSTLNAHTGWDDGSVLCTVAEPHRWVFTTVQTPDDLQHPVSGNREFGISPLPGHEYVLYTRGADRTTGYLDHALHRTVFNGADQLWTSMQRHLADFINSHGGLAHADTPTVDRHDWNTVAHLAGPPLDALPHRDEYFGPVQPSAPIPQEPMPQDPHPNTPPSTVLEADAHSAAAEQIQTSTEGEPMPTWHGTVTVWGRLHGEWHREVFDERPGHRGEFHARDGENELYGLHSLVAKDSQGHWQFVRINTDRADGSYHLYSGTRFGPGHEHFPDVHHIPPAAVITHHDFLDQLHHNDHSLHNNPSQSDYDPDQHRDHNHHQGHDHGRWTTNPSGYHDYQNRQDRHSSQPDQSGFPDAYAGFNQPAVDWNPARHFHDDNDEISDPAADTALNGANPYAHYSPYQQLQVNEYDGKQPLADASGKDADSSFAWPDDTPFDS